MQVGITFIENEWNKFKVKLGGTHNDHCEVECERLVPKNGSGYFGKITTLSVEYDINNDIQYTRNADKQIRVIRGALCGLSPRYCIHNILFRAWPQRRYDVAPIDWKHEQVAVTKYSLCDHIRTKRFIHPSLFLTDVL
jgi:hypothetical protein